MIIRRTQLFYQQGQVSQMYHLSDQQIRQEIDKMFLRYDRDRSNTLDPSELAPFLNQIFEKTKYPCHVSNLQEAVQLLKYIDVNHDGNISKIQIFNVFKYLINSSAEINGVNLNQNNGNYGQSYGNNGQQSYGNNGQKSYGNSNGGNNPYANNYGGPNNYGYNQNFYSNKNPYEDQNSYNKKNSQEDLQPLYFSNYCEPQINQSNQNPDINILGLLANSLHNSTSINQQGNQMNTYKVPDSNWGTGTNNQQGRHGNSYKSYDSNW